MTELSALRLRLNALRWQRQAVRWGAGLAALGLAVLWTLTVAFALDWLLEMSKLQRAVMIVAGIGVILWATRRFVLHWFGVRESLLDMALLVERQQKIDSDLVAALQFESPHSTDWGSTQLQGAVVSYVADFGRDLNVFEGFSWKELGRRCILLASTVAAIGLAIVLFPAHFDAFINRLLLGARHYPTDTTIDAIVVNDQPLELQEGQAITVKSAYGLPLQFAVEASGDEPQAGRVDFTSIASGLETTIDLAKLSSEQGVYKFNGSLPKLVDSLTYQVYLGDAWTDPAEITVIPLPIVELTLTPTSPNYARGTERKADAPEGARQIAVLEGSRVDLSIACRNKKLKSATLTIADQVYSLSRVQLESAKGDVWSLVKSDALADSPLARVMAPVRYQVQVIDEDGLKLEHPIEGFIRIRADQKPRITADVVTRAVLPTAEPAIEYRVSDDYGIGKLLVHVQAIPQEEEPTGSESADDSAESLEPPPSQVLPLKELAQPIAREVMPLKDTYRLNLASLRVKKGDQVKVTLEAVDYRGNAPGQSAVSEPILLQVTDESGVLAAISESDERSARQLDAIIQRQLGIGDSK